MEKINSQVYEKLKEIEKDQEKVIDTETLIFQAPSIDESKSIIKQLANTFLEDENEKLKKIAGILLLDFTRNNWAGNNLGDEFNKEIVLQLVQQDFESYNLINLQTRIISEIIFDHFPDLFSNTLEGILEQI